MGPIWGRQEPGGPHVGPMNFAIWVPVFERVLPNIASSVNYEHLHFPRYCPFVRGIHRSPVDFPHKGQWRGALIFLFNVEQAIELPVIWHAITLIMTSRNVDVRSQRCHRFGDAKDVLQLSAVNDGDGLFVLVLPLDFKVISELCTSVTHRQLLTDFDCDKTQILP